MNLQLAKTAWLTVREKRRKEKGVKKKTWMISNAKWKWLVYSLFGYFCLNILTMNFGSENDIVDITIQG